MINKTDLEIMLASFPEWQLAGNKTRVLDRLSTMMSDNDTIIALQEAFTADSSTEGVLFITDSSLFFIPSDKEGSYAIELQRSGLTWSCVASYASCLITFQSGSSKSSFTIVGSEKMVKRFADKAAAGATPKNDNIDDTVVPDNGPLFTWNTLNDSITALFDTITALGKTPGRTPPPRNDGPNQLEFLFNEAKKINSLLNEAYPQGMPPDILNTIAQDMVLIASLGVYADGLVTNEERLFLAVSLMPIKTSDDPAVKDASKKIFTSDILPPEVFNTLESYWNYLASFIKDSAIELADGKLKSLTAVTGADEQDILMRHDRIASAYMLFINCLVKADGTITKEEEERLTKIIALIQRSQPDPKAVVQPPEKDETFEEVMKKIDDLVGMKNIKEQITTFVNLIKVQKEREQRNMPVAPLSLHAVFYGPPGTGKTTIARLLGKVYKSLKLLSQGHLTETDRAGLVAGYVGQTAIKTDEIIQKAMDGVLFIDEAYSLSPLDGANDFGQEAIDTLLKRMEDYREKFVVIAAGYTDEMQLFINSNPGLKSRFNRFFYFDHYKPEDLLLIMEMFVKNAGFKLDADAKAKALAMFSDAYDNRDRTFGNGRFVRNVFERSVERQANRIAGIAPLTDGILTTLTTGDIPLLSEMIS